MLRRLLVLLLLIVACVIAYRFVAGRMRDQSSHRQPDRQQDGAPDQYPHSSRHSGFAQLGCGSESFADWEVPALGSCRVQFRSGYPIPDPSCTPGGFNPSITVGKLRDPAWRTRSIRNCATGESQKHIVYRWYAMHKPRVNSDQNQVCELDHLVPLELGGSDDLSNIWPQCGPKAVEFRYRYFKIKDKVENYLADQVKSGRMSLDVAQRGIASDWTKYIQQAKR